MGKYDILNLLKYKFAINKKLVFSWQFFKQFCLTFFYLHVSYFASNLNTTAESGWICLCKQSRQLFLIK